MGSPSFTLNPLADQQISWPLVDATDKPITGAAMTATLYANRDKFQPGLYPGTADAILNNLTMTETPTASGTYIAQVPETFNPVPATSGFITVLVAKDGLGAVIADFEIPTVVTYPQNTIDLVTVSDVKSWMGVPDSNTSCDRAIQLIISSISQYILNATGRASFKNVIQYTEVYDGNGNDTLFVNNYPIQSLVSLNIGTYSVPISTGITTPGIYVQQSQKCISFRNSGFSLSAPLSIYPYIFTRGKGNIQVVYMGGYTAVPFDLQEIVIEAAAQNHKRQDWIDLMSKSMSIQGSTGTTRYRDWMFPPYVMSVIEFYSRYARP